MKKRWPDFSGEKLADGTLYWRGPLKPKAQLYFVSIFWHPPTMSLPYVRVKEPLIAPRPGGTYEEIPHLLFGKNEPAQSGLCLFDPAGKEWSGADLIAETTVPWTAEWLVYYELWHLTGEWLGPSVGYESVAQMHAAQAGAVQQALAHVH